MKVSAEDMGEQVSLEGTILESWLRGWACVLLRLQVQALWSVTRVLTWLAS
jgi:hypothetical protein